MKFVRIMLRQQLYKLMVRMIYGMSTVDVCREVKDLGKEKRLAVWNECRY